MKPDRLTNYGHMKRILLAFFAFTSAAYSQVLYGSLTGNVKDASGGAVPGAEVSAQERGTGLTRKTTTNESGVYVIPTLPGGVYAVTITKQGFAALNALDINVPVNAVTRVDTALQVGAVTETVRVEATPPALQTDRAEVRA